MPAQCRSAGGSVRSALFPTCSVCSPESDLKSGSGRSCSSLWERSSLDSSTTSHHLSPGCALPCQSHSSAGTSVSPREVRFRLPDAFACAIARSTAAGVLLCFCAADQLHARPGQQSPVRGAEAGFPQKWWPRHAKGKAGLSSTKPRVDSPEGREGWCLSNGVAHRSSSRRPTGICAESGF